MGKLMVFLLICGIVFPPCWAILAIILGIKGLKFVFGG